MGISRPFARPIVIRHDGLMVLIPVREHDVPARTINPHATRDAVTPVGDPGIVPLVGAPGARTHAVTFARRCAIVRSSQNRSEEHTSELQSRSDLVCRLLLEKKKKQKKKLIYKT